MKIDVRVYVDEEKPLTGLKLFMPDIPEPLATVDLNESETRKSYLPLDKGIRGKIREI